MLGHAHTTVHAQPQTTTTPSPPPTTMITTPPPTPQMVHDRNETGTSVLDLSLASIPVNKRKAVKEATADLVDPLMPK